jgi:hypothetical protein
MLTDLLIHWLHLPSDCPLIWDSLHSPGKTKQPRLGRFSGVAAAKRAARKRHNKTKARRHV